MEHAAEQSAKQPKEKPPVVYKTCECRLVAPGVDLFIANVTLDERKGLESFAFAKAAFKKAANSLKRLECNADYKIVVIDRGARNSFSLSSFTTHKETSDG